MATLTNGESATLSLDAFASVNVVAGGQCQGTMVWTSTMPSRIPSFTSKIQNKVYGPHGAPMTLVITVTAGSLTYTIDSETGGFARDAANNISGYVGDAGAALNPWDATIASPSTRFWLPWVRNSSVAVMDKAGVGNATKTGAGSATQVAGYFTSLAGTYGAGGTGMYYEIATSQGDFDVRSYSVIFHIGIKKAAPGGTEELLGNQQNGTVPGLIITAAADGAARMYLRSGSGGTQNSFTAITGVFDNTDHQLTLVIDRATGTGYTYLDSVLQETKVLTLPSTTASGNAFRFGAYSASSAFTGAFFNSHLYVFDKNLADINAANCVNHLCFARLPLSIGHLQA